LVSNKATGHDDMDNGEFLMRKVVLVAVCGLFMAFSQVAAAQQINLGTLLEDMIDRTKIAEFPDPAFFCKQCSSYNREAVTAGKPGWFANADSSFFYGLDDVEGRR